MFIDSYFEAWIFKLFLLFFTFIAAVMICNYFFTKKKDK